MYKRKCVRSLRVARELMARGFPAVDTEPSRNVPGMIVWIFEETPEFKRVFSEIVTKSDE